MKRIFAALGACVLLLAACGGPAAPAEEPSAQAVPTAMTEAEVLAAYEAAAEVYDWFDLASLPAAGEQVTADGAPYDPETDGVPYQAVDSPGLSTYAQLEARVRACFAPALADELLESGVNYRDIGGRLCTLGGARGSNLYLLDKTAAAERVDDGHWTVTLTFWADSYAWEQPSATVGYSQTVLDYEKTEDGWRFTSFCSSDGLDLEADTVFAFHYGGDSFSEDEQGMENWSDFKLACWLLHADGLSEGASSLLTSRFLEDPEAWFSALSVFVDSPFENAQHVMEGPAGATYAWFGEAEQRQFQDILASYLPKNDSEQALLNGLKADWTRTVQRNQGDSTFCFSVDGQCLTLGGKEGAYPWSYTGFPETPDLVGRGDNGETCYAFSFGGVEVKYFTYSDADGGTESYVNRMETVSPAVETWWGVSVGDGEDAVLAAYPGAEFVAPERIGDGGESAWCWPGDKKGLGSHITFYMKDGAVVRILMENLEC